MLFKIVHNKRKKKAYLKTLIEEQKITDPREIKRKLKKINKILNRYVRIY